MTSCFAPAGREIAELLGPAELGAFEGLAAAADSEAVAVAPPPEPLPQAPRAKAAHGEDEDGRKDTHYDTADERHRCA